MNKIKAILFDADGVVTLPEEFFSQVYAKSRGLDPAPFEAFFKTQFPAARIGKADLKELILNDPALWQWNGEVDELLGMWFQTENVRNEPLLKLIQEIRAKGVPCYLATNQEKYRGEYFENEMFKDEFDGFFISAILGVEKPTHEFFNAVMSELKEENSDIEAGEVIFIDDSQSNIQAAENIGMKAHQYRDVESVRSILEDM